MLNIILFLLKIIGILILVILGLVLAVIFLVLLVPIRYQLTASYHEMLKAGIRISWLLQILSVFVTYEKELGYAVKIFGSTVCSSEKSKTVQTDIPDVDEVMPSEVSVEQESSAKKPVSRGDAVLLEEVVVQSQSSDTTEVENAPQKTESVVQTEAPKASAEAKKSLLAKLQQKYSDVKNQILSLQHKADQILVFVKDPDNQATFKLIFRQVRSILKHLLPKKVKADLILGFDDPATTGQVLSICSFLYLWYGESVNITPVFDESIIEGDVDIRGRIRLGTLAALAVRILFNRNFRILLKRWRVNGGILDG